jgi:hypothetical protein
MVKMVKCKKATMEAQKKHKTVFFKRRIQVMTENETWEVVNTLSSAKKKTKLGHEKIAQILKSGGNKLLRYHPDDQARFDLWHERSRKYPFHKILRALQICLWYYVKECRAGPKTRICKR